MNPGTSLDRAFLEIDQGFDELVELTQALIRIPTVNPPGAEYGAAAAYIGDRLEAWGHRVAYVEAAGLNGTRPNVIGTKEGDGPGPVVHLNGHFDVVPPGDGWTSGAFDAELRDGRIYGRGSCDMKAGLACAMFAVEALRRAGAPLPGQVQVSATVDEESGGTLGVGHLVDAGIVSASSVDYAIIPEPFGPDRICVGHRGVLWTKIRALGRVAHGSMPHLGRSAIDDLVTALEAINRELGPRAAAQRTEVPVVPEASRRGSLNVNGVYGGQGVDAGQSPCVADSAEAVIDRRFIAEEDWEAVRQEIPTLLGQLQGDDPERTYQVEEMLAFQPVHTPPESRLIEVLSRGVEEVRGMPAERVASPGTYDHKHFARAGGGRVRGLRTRPVGAGAPTR